MSLYKRKDSSVLWCKFSVRGEIVQRSTGTADKVKAREYHDRLKVELWEQSKLGTKPVRSWQEAVLRFLQETKENRTYQHSVEMFRRLDSLLCGLSLNDFTVSKIDEIRQAKGVGRSKSTVNRYLSMIRVVLNKAVEWEWLDKAPRITMYKEPSGRARFLTREQVHGLLRELPEHLQDMVIFTLSTGLRYSNVLKLEWSQVNLQQAHMWVDASNSKNGKALSIPLNAQALMVLEKQVGKHPQRVFTKAGRPIYRANGNLWRNALKRAGIEDFRWHDLRHTWASWCVQSGVTVFEVQHLGGWSSSRMVDRYAHLSSEHLARAAARLDSVPIGYVSATVQLQQDKPV
ncbi:MAG: tyrosine-type recombinase/integrase [Gallionellaceae bacterium]